MKDRTFTLLCIALVAVLCAVVAVGFDMAEKDGGKLALIQPEYMSRLFGEGKVVQIDIIMDEAELDDMLSNAMLEQFHESSVIVDGSRIDNVAIRTKGNSSLFSIAGARSGSQSSRFSFKIDFNEYVKKQNLWGLKKLNLNNCFSDPTYMREYITYGILEGMGLATPGRVFVSLSINGKEWGLYLGVEAIEEEFLARSFLNAKGDLYKPDGTGSDLKWIGDDAAEYTGLNLKNNEGKQDEEALLAFLSAINGVGGEIEDVLDVDSTLRYLAISTALGNFDSYQGQMKHNYYLYEQDGVFTVIGWDFNMSFGGFAYMLNEDGAAVAIDEPVQGAISDRPLIEALLKVDVYKQKYYEYLRTVVTDYLSADYIGGKIEELSMLIKPYIGLGDEGPAQLEAFQASLSGSSSKAPNLQAFADEMGACILAQLDGSLPKTAAELGLASSGGFGGAAIREPAGQAMLGLPDLAAVAEDTESGREIMQIIESVRRDGIGEEEESRLLELGLSVEDVQAIKDGQMRGAMQRPEREGAPGPVDRGAGFGGFLPPDGFIPPDVPDLPSSAPPSAQSDQEDILPLSSPDAGSEASGQVKGVIEGGSPAATLPQSGAMGFRGQPVQTPEEPDEETQPITLSGLFAVVAVTLMLPAATIAIGKAKRRKFTV